MDDDWENCDLELVIPNLEQLKERKLIEEADNALTDELFNGVKQVFNDIKKPNEEVKEKKKFIKEVKEVKEVKEEKSLSKKEKKKLLKRENDLFGEPIYDDEYAEYEDKFHK